MPSRAKKTLPEIYFENQGTVNSKKESKLDFEWQSEEVTIDEWRLKQGMPMINIHCLYQRSES